MGRLFDQIAARPWILVFCVGCLVYANTLTNERVLDDQALIPHHPGLGNAMDLWGIFSGRYWQGLRETDTLYRPFTIWTLSVNAALNRATGVSFSEPTSYRILNVLVHAGVGALFYRLGLRLGLNGLAALAAALLFAVHPIHTEAVNGIVNRSELLSALFGLWFLVRHLERARPSIGAVCLFLALCSKESAVTWVPLALWFDFLNRGNRIGPMRYAAWAPPVLIWYALRAGAIAGVRQGILPLDNPTVGEPLLTRLWTALGVQFDYLRLQALPFGLSTDYAFDQVPLLVGPADWRLAALGALIFLAAILVRRVSDSEGRRRIGFALGGYVLLFAVTANVWFPIGTLMAERLAYGPSLMICLLAGLAVSRFVSLAGRLGLGVCCLGLLVLAGLTLVQNGLWATPESFYQAQVKSAPRSAKAHYALARSVHHPAGNLEAAILHYRQALSILPEYPDAWNNLGVAHRDSGDLEAALDAYREAIERHEGHPQAHYNRGWTLQQMGRMREAEEAYERALVADPDYAATYNNLALICVQLGKPERARELLDAVLKRHPDYEPARRTRKVLFGDETFQPSPQDGIR